jgi:hypothetical protein
MSWFLLIDWTSLDWYCSVSNAPCWSLRLQSNMSVDQLQEELHLLSEVAKAAGVHPRTLQRWAEVGKIPKPRKLKANGRRVYTTAQRATIVSFARETTSD